MSKLFTYKINRIAAYFALCGFALSSILFQLNMATEAGVVEALGIGLLIVFVLLSPILFIILCANALINYKDIKQHVLAIFMVVVNSAIAILYSKLLTDF